MLVDSKAGQDKASIAFRVGINPNTFFKVQPSTKQRCRLDSEKLSCTDTLVLTQQSNTLQLLRKMWGWNMLHEIVCAQPFVCRLVCNIHKHPYIALVLDIQGRGVEIYKDPL